MRRRKKHAMCIASALLACSALVAEDIDINSDVSVPYDVEQNGNIAFKGGGNFNCSGGYCITVSGANSLGIDTSQSSRNPFAYPTPTYHLALSPSLLFGNIAPTGSAAVDLSGAGDNFALTFKNGGSFGINTSNSGDSELAAIRTPRANGASINFGSTRLSLNSSVSNSQPGSTAASVLIGHPVIDGGFANGIKITKDASAVGYGGNFYSSVPTDVDADLYSVAFGAGLAKMSGQSGYQMCKLDLSGFDLSGDSVTLTSGKYACGIGAAHVYADDNSLGIPTVVDIHQFDDIVAGNIGAVEAAAEMVSQSVLTSGYYPVAAASAFGGARALATLSHNGNKISQFCKSESGKCGITNVAGQIAVEVYTPGNYDFGAATVVGCADLRTKIGDDYGDPVENCEINQFNGLSIDKFAIGAKLTAELNAYSVVIGNAYSDLSIYSKAENSKITAFDGLMVGATRNENGEIVPCDINSVTMESVSTSSYSGYLSCSVIGAGGANIGAANSNEINYFNNLVTGNITNSRLSASSQSAHASVIGCGYMNLSGSGTHSAFNNMKVGNISSNSELSTLSQSAHASVMGCGYMNLSGSGMCNAFNEMTVGDIANGSKLNASTQSSYASVIGCGNMISSSPGTYSAFNNMKIGNISSNSELNALSRSVFTSVIGCGSMGLSGSGTHSAFNNMKVGNISSNSKLNASSGASASVIGCGSMGLGGSGTHNAFNEMTVGDITNGSELSTSSNAPASVIGCGSISLSGSSTDSAFNNMKVGNVSLNSKLNILSGAPASVIGCGSMGLGGSGTHNAFNEMTVGDITNGSELNASSGSPISAIGCGNINLNGSSTDSAFNNMKVGNISSNSKLNASSQSAPASVIGCGSMNLSSSGTHNAFNEMTVGDIANGSELNASSSSITSVIGCGSMGLSDSGTHSAFNNMKVGNISSNSKLNASSQSAPVSVIGCGNMNSNSSGTCNAFNKMTVGDITNGSELSTSSQSDPASVIGCGNMDSCGSGACNAFNNMKVGNIFSNSKLSASSTSTNAAVIGCGCMSLSGSGTRSAFNNMTVGNIFSNSKLTTSSGASASVLGCGFMNLSSSDMCNAFNVMTVGDITNGSELSASAQYSNMSVIGCGYLELVDSGPRYAFNKMTVGNISYGSKLSASSYCPISVIGCGYLGLLGEDVRSAFNGMKVGNISSNSKLSASSTSTNAAVIGCGEMRISILDTCNVFDEMTVGDITDSRISSKMLAESSYDCGCAASVIGAGILGANGSNVSAFNSTKIGNITDSCMTIKSSASQEGHQNIAASVVGAAYSYMEPGSLPKVWNDKDGITYFNDLTVGNISNSHMLVEAASHVRECYTSVIGAGNLSADYLNCSAFNSTKIGNITNSHMTIKSSAAPEDYSRVVSSVIGSGCTYSYNCGSTNVHNGMTIGDIEKSELSTTLSSGSQYDSMFAASVIGAGAIELYSYADSNTGDEPGEITYFNDLTVGNIANSKLFVTASSPCSEAGASVFGAGILIAEGGSHKMFNNAEIGNITNSQLYTTLKSDPSSSMFSVGNIIGSGATIAIGGDTHSVYNNMSIKNISGSKLEIKDSSAQLSGASVIGGAALGMFGESSDAFNGMKIGDIANKSELTIKNAPQYLSCTSVIGNGIAILYGYGDDNGGSTSRVYNDMSIGNIDSSKLEISTSSAALSLSSVIGSGALGSLNNTFSAYNGMKIGNITNSRLITAMAAATATETPIPPEYCMSCGSVIGVGYLTENEIIPAPSENSNIAGALMTNGCSVSLLRYTTEMRNGVLGRERSGTVNAFNNMVIGKVNNSILESRADSHNNAYSCVLGAAFADINPGSKIFSNVSAEFQGKTNICSYGYTDGDGANVYLNTLGGWANGFYDSEGNKPADGMRVYFSGDSGSAADNSIVVASLIDGTRINDVREKSGLSVTENCRAFALGSNYQINIGRTRTIGKDKYETSRSIINGGTKSNVGGTLRILGNITKAPLSSDPRNTAMRIDGGWDAQCFGNIRGIGRIDIIDGKLSLMGKSSKSKNELNTTLSQIGMKGAKYDNTLLNGKLTLTDGQLMVFGVDSGISDSEINSKFSADNVFAKTNGILSIRNDGSSDANMLYGDGGKLAINDIGNGMIDSGFYVIRLEKGDNKAISGNGKKYKISKDDFNEDGYFGDVSLYRISDKDGKSIVMTKESGYKVPSDDVDAYLMRDSKNKVVGVMIFHPGNPEMAEDFANSYIGGGSTDNADDVTSDASAVRGNIGSELDYIKGAEGNIDTYHIADARTFGGRIHVIGGSEDVIPTPYRTRYGLTPKVFISPFGEYDHQKEVDDLGYNSTTYGFTVGGSLAKELESTAVVKAGIIGSFSKSNTKYRGKASMLGRRNEQKMAFGGIYGVYEKYNEKKLRTNLNTIIGYGHFKNDTWMVMPEMGKVTAKSTSNDIHVSVDFVKNMIGSEKLQLGPWVSVAYNHIHEKAHDEACNGVDLMRISSVNFDFVDTTLGVNLERHINIGHDNDIFARIYAKAGWFSRPIRKHSSCNVLVKDMNPYTLTPELHLTSKNAAVISGGIKAEINKRWELSAGITSRIARNYWLINGNIVIGYSF